MNNKTNRKIGMLALGLATVAGTYALLGNVPAAEAHNMNEPPPFYEKLSDEQRAQFDEMKKFGFRGHHRGPSVEERAEMDKIFEGKNFEEWKTKVEERAGDRAAEIATAENFAKLLEAHELRKSGDFEAARELHQQVFPFHFQRMHGMEQPQK